MNQEEIMKRVVSKYIGSTVVAIGMLLPVAGFAGIIGNWETDLDGWADWGAGAAYTAAQTEGVTVGSGSLLVEQTGWGQSLSIGLSEAQKADFMANSILSIDVSVAATPGITAGFSQVASVNMNGNGPGWTTVIEGNPINFYWWDGRPDETQTLQVDYSAFKAALADTSYIEIIFTLNNGGGAPSQMYFDNAQLIPEPATIGLIGIFGGGLLMVRRRFKI